MRGPAKQWSIAAIDPGDRSLRVGGPPSKRPRWFSPLRRSASRATARHSIEPRPGANPGQTPAISRTLTRV
jgi:hypothetical protein